MTAVIDPVDNAGFLEEGTTWDGERWVPAPTPFEETAARIFAKHGPDHLIAAIKELREVVPGTSLVDARDAIWRLTGKDF